MNRDVLVAYGSRMDSAGKSAEAGAGWNRVVATVRIVLGVILLWASEVHVEFFPGSFWGPLIAIGEFTLGAALLMAGPAPRDREPVEVKEASS